jgi:hypothetical protein
MSIGRPSHRKTLPFYVTACNAPGLSAILHSGSSSALRSSHSPNRKTPPATHERLPLLLQVLADVNLPEPEPLAEEVEQTLFPEKERDVVRRRDVVDAEHLLGGDVAEHGHFLHRRREEGFLASARDLPGQPDSQG